MSKEDFVNELKTVGLTAELTPDSIPVVYVRGPLDVHEAHIKIKQVIRDTGYDKSYGITALNEKSLAEA